MVLIRLEGGEVTPANQIAIVLACHGVVVWSGPDDGQGGRFHWLCERATRIGLYSINAPNSIYEMI